MTQNGQHVQVLVTGVGDYTLPEPEICRFSMSPQLQLCKCCGDIIFRLEVHFNFGGDRYCLGCVKYD
jgi:hypothetical protein